MAFNVGTGLDFGSLKKMPVRKRIELLRDRPDGGVTELSRLTPAQFAELFPRYWEKRLPDIGGFQAAISKKFIQRQEDINTGLAKKVGTTVEEAEKIGRTERLKKGVPDVMDAPSRVDKSKTKLEKKETISSAQQAAYDKIKQGPVATGSPEGKLFSKFSDKELESFGVTKSKDNNGRDVFTYKKPEVSDQQVVEKLKATPSGEGSNATIGQRLAFYRQYAKSKGVDPDLVTGIVMREGGQTSNRMRRWSNSDPGKDGVGTAYGDFQLNVGSERNPRMGNDFQKRNPNVPMDAAHWKEQGTFAIDQIAAGRTREWMSVKDNGGEENIKRIGANEWKRNETPIEPIKPEGPNGEYSDAQKAKMREQMIQDIGEGQGREYQRDVLKYEKEHNLPSGTLGSELSGEVTVNEGTKKLGQINSYKSAGKGYCGIGTRYAARDLFGDGYFNSGLSSGSGGSSLASSLSRNNDYFQRSGYYKDRENVDKNKATDPAYLSTLPIGTVISAQGGNKGYGHVQIKLGSNRWVSYFDQSGVLSERRDGQQYHGYSVHIPNQKGLDRMEAQGYATTIASTDTKPEKQAPEEAHDTDQASKDADINLPAQPGEQAAVPVVEQTAPKAPGAPPEQTAKVEKPTEPEKPKGPQSYSLNRQALANSIRQTEDFKREAGIFAGAVGDDTIINGFFADSRTKKIMQETGTTWDPATGKITSKNPDKLLKSFGDMDTTNILSPEKRAEGAQTTQTATIGEKLQREFGVASAQAATGQGDAFAREEAYRKAHPYGPEMPTESKVTGGVSDKIEKTAGATGLRPNSKLIDYTSSATVPAVGISHEQYNAFRESIASIESRGGVYGLQGGGGKKYDGAYQFNANAKKDANKTLGANLPSREEFRKNPMLQEQLFDHYVAFNHRVLMQKSKIYRTLSPEKKLEVLGYAHNQGAGGAAKWLRTGQSHKDAFGTDATKYANTINKELAALRQSQALEATQLAQAETVKTTEAPKAATPEAPKTTSPLGPLGSGGAAAAETPVTPATPTTVEPTAQAKTPTATATPATPTTGGPEFPKNKPTETPLPPSRDVSAAPSTPTPSVTPTTVHQPTGAVTGTPQSGAPDESSTNSFLKSQGIPGASDGGNFKTGNQPISFYPMDKKDNIAAVNPITQQPLFTAKSGETVSVNPEQKIKLNDKPLDRVGSEIDSLKEQMTSIMERQAAGEPVRQATNKLMHETPQKPVTIDPFLKQKTVGFPTPSLERAMSRTRGAETGSGTDGHHFSRTSIA